MKKIEDHFKDNLKAGMDVSSALRDAAKKLYGISYDLSSFIEKTYSAASKKSKKPRKRKRKPNWIRRDIRRPGRFRRFAERWGLADKGTSIPYWVKDEGCRDPQKVYKKVTGKKLKKKAARIFQKEACLARTFFKFPAAHRGPALNKEY